MDLMIAGFVMLVAVAGITFAALLMPGLSNQTRNAAAMACSHVELIAWLLIIVGAVRALNAG